MIRTVVAFLALSASITTTQAPPLVGKWKLNYPGGMRMTNGDAETIMATGSLTITATKDSLLGELVMDPSPDLTARPPAHLAGKLTTGETVLISRSKATISMNGSQEEAVSVSTWNLRAKGDSLTGTVERKIEGHEMANQGASQVTGTRQKS
jgi:hypothetical protein